MRCGPVGLAIFEISSSPFDDMLTSWWDRSNLLRKQRDSGLEEAHGNKIKAPTPPF